MKTFSMSVVVLLVLAAYSAGASAQPQFMWATNLNDSGPGSLRAAVAQVLPNGTIAFNVTGTIQLKSEIIVPHSITIIGNAGPVRLRSTGKFRCMSVQGDFTARSLEFENGGGVDVGAGLWVGGDLTLTYGVAIANKAIGGGANGGGMYVRGNAQLFDTHLIGNLAQASGSRRSARGGGILVGGTLSLVRPTIRNNRAVSLGESGIALGGGSYSSEGTQISGMHCANNHVVARGPSPGRALAYGGCHFSFGTINITESEILNNLALAEGSLRPRCRGNCGPVALGGGVFSIEPITLSDVQLRGNRALSTGGRGQGGGLYVGVGGTGESTSIFRRGVVTRNRASTGGGGIWVREGRLAALVDISGNVAPTCPNIRMTTPPICQ